MSKLNKINFIITGSIAAYKSAELLSKLTQEKYEVQTIVTQNALKFIGSATIEGLTGIAPLYDLFESEKMMSHIFEIRACDLIVVAPATANFINKIANGIGDDLASTLLLAHRFDKPLLIAPAMNSAMYQHPATQDSLQKLKKWGAVILEPQEGILACGEIGPGRMVEPEQIFSEIKTYLKKNKSSASFANSDSKNMALSSSPVTHSFIELSPSEIPQKAKVLISAGGTQEKIDSVRVISNLSTGSTGVFLAEGLQENGFDVTLLRANNAKDTEKIKNKFSFTDFLSLQNLIKNQLEQKSFDVVVHLAAVSDYHCSRVEGETPERDSSILNNGKISGKISSQAEELKLILKKNKKIVNEIKSYSQNKNIKLISFKLTDTDIVEDQIHAVTNLIEDSNSDLVIHNDMNKIRNQKYLFQAFYKDKNSHLSSSKLENPNELLNYLTQWIRKGKIYDSCT